jgi:NAD(P)-dependent dehydrogenase (short-subunit alcohol dehydrogenase family)
MSPAIRSKRPSDRGWIYAALGAGAAAAALYWRSRPGDSLREKTVLITGGSRGLGLQLARDFAAEGCRIAICARNHAELQRAEEDLRARGAEVDIFVCDVGDRVSSEQLIEEVEERLGRIDILVNNAGVIQVGPVENMEVEDFEEAMQTMFYGVLYSTLAVLPGMLKRRSGTIVNITSVGGKVGIPHLSPYCSAKFAAVGLSETLSAELKPKGVEVVTVVPGLMRTGSHLNAKFKGRAPEEFEWFGLGATMPGLAMEASRASQEIVSAVRRRLNYCILSLPANVLARVHGAVPELTGAVLAAVQIALPKPGEGTATWSGWEAQRDLNSDLHYEMIAPGRTAAADLNEL